MRIGAGTVAGLAGLAVAHGASGAILGFGSRTFDDIAAVDVAQSAIEHEHLSTLSSACLDLSPTADGPSKFSVDVRTHHSTECGGDAGAKPLLFTIDVDGAHKTLRLQRTGEPDRFLKWRNSR